MSKLIKDTYKDAALFIQFYNDFITLLKELNIVNKKNFLLNNEDDNLDEED